MEEDDSSIEVLPPTKKPATKTGLKKFSKLKITSLPISHQIEYIKLKEQKILEKGRVLIYKNISTYICDKYNQLLHEKNLKPIKVICSEISDKHYSKGDCKRTITIINSCDKKKENIKPVGKYSYWYNDSAIDITSSNISEKGIEGILFQDCFMEKLSNDQAEEFFQDVDNEIYWKWFK